MHRLQIHPIVHCAQLGSTPTISQSYIQVRAVVWACAAGHRHADVRDQYTFCIVMTYTKYTKCNNQPCYVKNTSGYVSRLILEHLKVICNDFLVVNVNCWSHALI